MIKKTIFALSVLAVALIVSLVAHTQATDTTTTTTTPGTNAGLALKDTGRGLEFQAPNDQWTISASKYSISLNHDTHFDAFVILKDSWYTVGTAKEAYDKRKEVLLSYLPGAQFIKENENMTLPSSVTAISMTYKNPSDLKVIREILFVHKGKAFELVFQAQEENFSKVREDFGFILKNLKLF